jgi:hypothetical protein
MPSSRRQPEKVPCLEPPARGVAPETECHLHVPTRTDSSERGSVHGMLFIRPWWGDAIDRTCWFAPEHAQDMHPQHAQQQHVRSSSMCAAAAAAAAAAACAAHYVVPSTSMQNIHTCTHKHMQDMHSMRSTHAWQHAQQQHARQHAQHEHERANTNKTSMSSLLQIAICLKRDVSEHTRPAPA